MISRRHPRRVYVARGLRTGLYKIGVTRCLIERVRSLAAWLREPVEVMADLPGGLSDERAPAPHTPVVDAVAAERAAVVAYLRRRAYVSDPPVVGALRAAADDVEAAMHRERT